MEKIFATTKDKNKKFIAFKIWGESNHCFTKNIRDFFYLANKTRSFAKNKEGTEKSCLNKIESDLRDLDKHPMTEARVNTIKTEIENYFQSTSKGRTLLKELKNPDTNYLEFYKKNYLNKWFLFNSTDRFHQRIVLLFIYFSLLQKEEILYELSDDQKIQIQKYQGLQLGEKTTLLEITLQGGSSKISLPDGECYGFTSYWLIQLINGRDYQNTNKKNNSISVISSNKHIRYLQKNQWYINWVMYRKAIKNTYKKPGSFRTAAEDVFERMEKNKGVGIRISIYGKMGDHYSGHAIGVHMTQSGRMFLHDPNFGVFSIEDKEEFIELLSNVLKHYLQPPNKSFSITTRLFNNPITPSIDKKLIVTFIVALCFLTVLFVSILIFQPYFIPLSVFIHSFPIDEVLMLILLEYVLTPVFIFMYTYVALSLLVQIKNYSQFKRSLSSELFNTTTHPPTPDPKVKLNKEESVIHKNIKKDYSDSLAYDENKDRASSPNCEDELKSQALKKG